MFFLSFSYMTSRLLQYERTGYSLMSAMRVGSTKMPFFRQRQPNAVKKKVYTFFQTCTGKYNTFEISMKDIKQQEKGLYLRYDTHTHRLMQARRIRHWMVKLIFPWELYKNFLYSSAELLFLLQLRTSVDTDCSPLA